MFLFSVLVGFESSKKKGICSRAKEAGGQCFQSLEFFFWMTGAPRCATLG